MRRQDYDILRQDREALKRDWDVAMGEPGAVAEQQKAIKVFQKKISARFTRAAFGL